jgi:hypothetical protein
MVENFRILSAVTTQILYAQITGQAAFQKNIHHSNIQILTRLHLSFSTSLPEQMLMLKHTLSRLVTTLLAAMSSAAMAANPTSAALHQELSQKDAEFFERGFNQCDLAYLEANISAALKFYHDQGGLQDKKLFMQNTRQFICGDAAHKPIRKLTAGTLRTFPLYQDGKLYGAIQHGEHEFYLREPGKADRLTGSARFTSVWLKQGDDWQLSDVLSYDHQAARQAH